MRNLFTALLVTLFMLVACTPAGTVTPQSVADWVKANCGVLVQLIDIAALISANPAVASAGQLGGQVCEAVKSQRAELLKEAQAGNKSVPTEGVVIVNGVPVHYQVQ